MRLRSKRFRKLFAPVAALGFMGASAGLAPAGDDVAAPDVETLVRRLEAAEAKIRTLEIQQAGPTRQASQWLNPVSSEAVGVGSITPAAAPGKDDKKGPMDDVISEYLKRNPQQIAGGLSGTYDNGFLLKTNKGPFDIKFNLLTQIWLDHISNESSNPNLTDAFPSDGDSFLLRRAELKFSGHMISDRLSWRLMFDPVRAIGNNGQPTEAFPQQKRILKDLWFEYALIRPDDCCGLLDSLNFRIGQQKTPQTMEGYNHAGLTDFPERSIIGFRFGDFREPGALLFGTVLDKEVDYYAGLYNGMGIDSFRDENDQKDLIGRLVYHPLAHQIAERIKAAKEGGCEYCGLKDLSFGVSGSTGVDGRGGKHFHQDSFGLESNLEYGDYFARAEWYDGKPQGLNQATTPKNTDPELEGWYVTLGTNLTPHWQTAVRYQQFDPSEDRVDDLFTQTGLELTYFFDPAHNSKNHGAKIQAAYMINNVHSTAINVPTGILADGNEFTLAFEVDY